MAKHPKIHVGVEIGTSKTCFVVCQVNPNSSVRVLGIGSTKSAGIRKGEIIDFVQASACLKDALAQAESISNTGISFVHLSVTGAHIQGTNSSGAFLLPQKQSPITADHITEATNNAFDINLPEGRNYIHSIIRNYEIDDQILNVNPVGHIANRLSVHSHIIHGIGSRIQNSMKLIRECPLDLGYIAFAPIATAQMALRKEDKDNGALLIDIGAGTTDYVLYVEGAIVASGCIPVGGDHVTNDILHATGLSFSKAEKLKIREGNASSDPSLSVGVVKLLDEDGYAHQEVKRSVLNATIRERLEETLILVRDRLPNDALKGVNTGVFLSGGTSQTQGLSSLVSEIFQRGIYLSDYTESFSTDHPSYKDPRYTTALGLIRYAQLMDIENGVKENFLTRFFKSYWPKTR